jgi:voltage-gated potassium channel
VTVSDQFLTGDPDRDASRITYLFLITAIAVLSVLVAIAYYLVPIEEVRQVLIVLDTLYAVLMLLDFFIRLHAASDKKRYFLQGGWLDLLGSIPGYPFLRILRTYRIARNFREIRAETPQEVADMARDRLGESVLFIVSFVVLVVITVGSIAVVLVEAPAEGSNIKTGYDAMWWALVTIATVGYGDRVPVTGWGRIIGTFMIVVGVALFTTLTSYLASKLSARSSQGQRQQQLELLRQNARQYDHLLQRIASLEAQIAKAAGIDLPDEEQAKPEKPEEPEK